MCYANMYYRKYAEIVIPYSMRYYIQTCHVAKHATYNSLSSHACCDDAHNDACACRSHAIECRRAVSVYRTRSPVEKHTSQDSTSTIIASHRAPEPSFLPPSRRRALDPSLSAPLCPLPPPLPKVVHAPLLGSCLLCIHAALRLSRRSRRCEGGESEVR